MKYKSDGGYDDDQHSLLSQREQLLGEVTTVLSETRQLENELGRMETDIQGVGLCNLLLSSRRLVDSGLSIVPC